MNKNKIAFFIVFLLIAISLTGCIKISGLGDDDKTSQADNRKLGVYKSLDAGQSWIKYNQINNPEVKNLTIDNLSINQIVMDPNDNLALYLAAETGAYYSYDGGYGWNPISYFNNKNVNDIAVEQYPEGKCNIYAAHSAYIYKTTDCGRTWKDVFYDNRSGFTVTDLETENYNKNVIYAGTSLGEILKSIDFGNTWQTMKRIGDSVKQIIADENDTRIIYVLTEKDGIFKTQDGGLTWLDDVKATDINNGLKEFSKSKSARVMVQDKTQPNTFLYASAFGLLKTQDGGVSWEKIELIQPEKEKQALIYSLAIDPKNNNNILYGTATTVFKTTDGGVNWSTQQSPVKGYANEMLFDPIDSNIIYIAGKAIPKK